MVKPSTCGKFGTIGGGRPADPLFPGERPKVRVYTQAQMERRKRWARYHAAGMDGFCKGLGHSAAWATILLITYRLWHPVLLEVMAHIRWVP